MVLQAPLTLLVKVISKHRKRVISTEGTQYGPKVSGLTYKSRAKWKMLWGIYSAIYGEVNVSVGKCVEIKGRLCWKIAKLFYFCHLKNLVRPEKFGPYYVSCPSATHKTWKGKLLFVDVKKAYKGSRRIAPLILCIGTRWKMSDPKYALVTSASI